MAKDNKRKDGDKLKLIYYIVAIILIFAVPFASYNTKLRGTEEVIETGYSEFSKAVKEGRIKNVTIFDKKVEFEAEDSKGEVKKYKAARVLEDLAIVDKLDATNAEYKMEFTEPMNPFLSIILQMLSTFIMLFALWYFLSKILTKKMGDGGGVGPMSFGKSNAKIYVESTDGITFKNVAGQDEAKEQLTEIVDFLHNPKKYSAIGAKLPKGALLVGPPGTGKTLLAKAVAGEAKVPFFSISGSEFVEMFVGLGAAKVRDLFKQAHEKAPCIVFIDEIDTIGKKRDGSGLSGNDEREQTLNQLLSEMDGFEGNDGVVILAATNRPESLDPALLRPGRFDRRVPVELPDLLGREAILKVHAERIKKDPDIDYNAVARATAGASGADLANMINEAALRAVREGRDSMTQRDIEESVEVVLAGYEKKNAVISPKEKEIIAYHEVGHAIVAAKQTNSAPVHKITIVPRTSGALGYTMQVDEEEKFLMSREDLFNKIVTLTGGRSAEELIFSIRTTGASNDIEQATKLARAMVTRFGMSEEFGFVAMESVINPYLGGDTSLNVSPETAKKIDDEVQKIVEQAHEKAINIIRENIDAMHEISNYLLQKETITGEEFMEILKKYDE
ncbi:ATP-dependent zinc metalloprotease FtsH [Anaerosphaera multitolerans]|uniref:ATP-dependent zinc metalloprotease FtsH n=1 Tax=Anaerosphaera multitolerans TaxID=2487351 RepID=A0A437S7E8_9FIRM|nr:ATP-dependent zinc metalloprotease FtsH [Anaerosphaera multitolerans]RVU54999.1 ATP-dependent metallopeptidase FtsH/Yme1/Tma family protein [Anaerosphaera multitolerans]